MMTLTLPAPVVAPKKSRSKKQTPADVTPTAPVPQPVSYPRLVIGSAFFALAVAVLSVSLPHLAEGMSKTLGVGWYAAVALAIIFDLSQIAAEAFLLTAASDDGEKWTAKGVIIGATAVSIAYNGMAFLSHAEGYFGFGTALTLAVALPIGVLALSYLGARSLFGK